MPARARAGANGRRSSLPGPASSNPFGLLADAALPGLAVALDPVAMAARFAAGFEERARGAAPRVRACVVEEVYYRPGRHCGVLYRLSLDAPAERDREEWLYARLLPGELLRERHQRAHDAVLAAGATALVRTALDPVSLWEDPGMILWVFPNDPRLPGVRQLADRARVGRRYALEGARLGAPGAGGGTRGVARWHADFERVKYMPCKRCVLRYRVTPERAEGPASVIYAKAYPDGAGAEPFRLQRHAWAALRAARSPVEIPEPLVHLAEESVLWFEDWGGRGLIGVARERGWEEMAERAAGAIAAFHLARIPGLGPGPEPASMLEEVLENGGKYASRVPSQRRLMGALLARLVSRRPATPGDAPRVSLHGAFRAEHVLVRGSRTALLDLDGMSEGDPLIDAAEFVASLEFLSLSGAQPALDPVRVSRRFLECYGAAVPWPLEGARLGWYALASLVSKMHGSVKRLARPTLERLERDGAALAERWSALGDWTHARRAKAGRPRRPRHAAARARREGAAR